MSADGPAAAPPAVLFVCARNAVRSPMAEALWRRRFGAGAAVASCGIDPAAYPDGFMVAVMGELGEDLSAFECRALSAWDGAPPALVVSVAPEADNAAADFARRHGARLEAWPIADPTAGPPDRARDQRLALYRAAREAIDAHIAAWSPVRP